MPDKTYEIQGILTTGQWLVFHATSRYRCLLAVRRFKSYEIICDGKVIERHVANQAEWNRHLERQLANHKQRRDSKHGARRSG